MVHLVQRASYWRMKPSESVQRTQWGQCGRHIPDGILSCSEVVAPQFSFHRSSASLF